MTTRLEILGDDGEWHEIPGVTSVELHEAEPEHDPVPDIDAWRRHDALDALHFAMTAREEAAQPKVIDQDGNPIRRPGPGRPAWQSPYGPPRRRH